MTIHLVRGLSRLRNVSHRANIRPIRLLQPFDKSVRSSSSAGQYNLPEFDSTSEATTREYVLLLPETNDESSTTNELLRLPKQGQPDTDYTKLSSDKLYFGINRALIDFENYVDDFNDQLSDIPPNLRALLGDIEQNIHPLENAFNILNLLVFLKPDLMDNPRFREIRARYYDNRSHLQKGRFRSEISRYVASDQLDEQEKKVMDNFSHQFPQIRPSQELQVGQIFEKLVENIARYTHTYQKDKQSFIHMVDDPDILAAASDDFSYCNQDHNDRTPLLVTVDTYDRFMRVCPDRFVRHSLWQKYNKRCSKLSDPKSMVDQISSNTRSLRRHLAVIRGYRSHFEYRLNQAMASSRQEVLETFNLINSQNKPELEEKLESLNDFASDNNFESNDSFGLQEYDLSYWAQKYSHEILIGVNRSDLRKYFPGRLAISGLQKFSQDYLGIKLKLKESETNKLWTNKAEYYEVERNGKVFGNLIIEQRQSDPHKNQQGNVSNTFAASLRRRSKLMNTLPLQYLRSNVNLNQDGLSFLSFEEIVELFFTYVTALQELLFDHDIYELNETGCFEVDTKNLFPFYCMAMFLNDTRILQSFSDRGNSKTIDIDLASKVLSAWAYFNCTRRYKLLYRAHLDLEINHVLTNIKRLSKDIHEIYSPFPRGKDNFDYCAMIDTLVGQEAGTNYSYLWSRQVANFSYSCLLDKLGTESLVGVDHNAVRKLNEKFIDCLFDPNKFRTSDKLESFFGRKFEPTQTGLGVL